MELIERLVVFVIFGLPGFVLIGSNYYRIFSKKVTASPAYLLGGVLGAIGVLAILGNDYKSRWYFILIPIVLDWGLFIVSILYAIFGPAPSQETEDKSEEKMKS